MKETAAVQRMLRSGGFHFLRLFQFVSPIFTVLAVEQLAEIIFFKHAEKVEHVGRCKIERGRPASSAHQTSPRRKSAAFR